MKNCLVIVPLLLLLAACSSEFDYYDGGPTRPDEQSYLNTVLEAGKVWLWPESNIPSFIENNDNADGPYFRPNMEVFPHDPRRRPLGAILICSGGSFSTRSNDKEGYPTAKFLQLQGYDCFVVNYRLLPNDIEARGADLQRAIRYVCLHAPEWGYGPSDVSLLGYSAGGYLVSEVALYWPTRRCAWSIDEDYEEDELDQVPVAFNSIAMLYAYIGDLRYYGGKGPLLDPAVFNSSNLPSMFFCYGTKDELAPYIETSIEMLQQVGYHPVVKVLEGYDHGFNIGKKSSLWLDDYLLFLRESAASTKM